MDTHTRSGAGLAALVSMVFASGCYAHSIRDAPQLKITSSKKDSEWNRYVSLLDDRCSRRRVSSLDSDESAFARYMEWLGQLSGKKPPKLDIVPDSLIWGIRETGPPAFFRDGGVYWYGCIVIQNNVITLPDLAHEFGHHTDAHLSYWEYFSSIKAAVRAEAVAEAFRNYVGTELIRQSNFHEGVHHRIYAKYPAQGTTFEQVLSGTDKYEAARALVALVGARFPTAARTWYFLAVNPVDDVFTAAHEIVNENGGLVPALQKGYSSLSPKFDR